jgi:hypothetical protein
MRRIIEIVAGVVVVFKVHRSGHLELLGGWSGLGQLGRFEIGLESFAKLLHSTLLVERARQRVGNTRVQDVFGLQNFAGKTEIPMG